MSIPKIRPNCRGGNLGEFLVYNKVVVVDEDDNVNGAERMTDARRAARVYVFNESGQLLVQHRSEKVLKPLMLGTNQPLVTLMREKLTNRLPTVN